MISALAIVVLFLLTTPTLAQEDGSRIDLLIVYTPAARDDVGSREAIETALAERVDELNTSLWASGVSTRMNLVHVTEVVYDELPDDQTRHHLGLPDDGYMDVVHDLRDEYAADLVALIVDERWDGCGEAERSGRWPTSWSPFILSKTYCGHRERFIPAFEHEIGHSMGLSHDRYSEIHVCCESLNRPTPYSHGYVNQRAFEPDAPVESRWVTIMSYTEQCGAAGFSCHHIRRFSNPTLTHLSDPTGIGGDVASADVAGPADAARALNEHRHIVANWRYGGPDDNEDWFSGTVDGFTDHLVPGVTPIKAIHFLELRERIDALRTRTGLLEMDWTDPALTLGVTPIRLVHVTELRNALAAVYSATGRQAPVYTDVTLTPGTPLRAVHLQELRNALLASESQ